MSIQMETRKGEDKLSKMEDRLKSVESDVQWLKDSVGTMKKKMEILLKSYGYNLELPTVDEKTREKNEELTNESGEAPVKKTDKDEGPFTGSLLDGSQNDSNSPQGEHYQEIGDPINHGGVEEVWSKPYLDTPIEEAVRVCYGRTNWNEWSAQQI